MQPGPPIPILRFFDLQRTLRFYVDWLGCRVDWQDGDGDGPTYLQISRGEMRLHLSSHHDDGTPGSAVLVPSRGVAELHAELHAKAYPFMRPGLERSSGGRHEMQVIDPASNRLRFWEPADDGEA